MLNESAVRHLAGLRGDPVVVSLYLDVDGRRRPRPSDYIPYLDHLLRTAREQAGGQATAVVEADLALISDWIATRLDRSTTRGVALFSARAQGLFEVFPLPVPVRDQVVVAREADVAQLAAVLVATSPVLVVATDHQTSRLVRVGRDGVGQELEAPLDEMERNVDTDVELGSFEHRHEEHVRQHLRRVARAAADELRRNGAAAIVLSGAHEVSARLEACLPTDAAASVVGRIALPVDSRTADLVTAARAAVEDVRRSQRRAALDETADRAAQGADAVTGLAATLEALNAGRVRTLVVDAAFAQPGGRCTTCEALVAGDGPCPRCGGTTAALSNVVDAAVTDAFAHHLTLELCQEGDLDRLGRIGALTRKQAQTVPSGG